jgi:hypothetical protein
MLTLFGYLWKLPSRILLKLLRWFESARQASPRIRIRTNPLEHPYTYLSNVSKRFDAGRKAEDTVKLNLSAHCYNDDDEDERTVLMLPIRPKPTDADEVEELMRVAMELSDRDIEPLRELVRIEGDAVRAQSRIPGYDPHIRWGQGSWGTRVVPELESVFCKLESYGHVSRIPPPNNLDIMADYQNRYVLLRKDTRFVDLNQSLGRTKAIRAGA